MAIFRKQFPRPYRLAVRTPPFHGGSRGSIPLRVAIFLLPLSDSGLGVSERGLGPQVAAPGPAAMAFMTPSVHNQEQEHEKTKDQEHHGSRFLLP